MILGCLGYTKFEGSLEIFNKWLDDVVIYESIITDEKIYPKAELFLIVGKDSTANPL